MPWEKQFDADEVLDKAMQAFWAHGYEATSMQDLVDRTGINRGSLYATYGGKRALFLSALRAYGERMCKQMLTELEDSHPPREAIGRLFETFAAQVPDGRPARGCFLTNTALELAAHDTEIRQLVGEAQEGIEAFFARMIRKGKAAGAFGADVKPAEAAKGLLATLIGVAVLSRSRPDRTLLRSIAGEALRRLD